ncbi:MAG: terminase small subunit, partial [Verrucomicrobiota bacterium]
MPMLDNSRHEAFALRIAEGRLSNRQAAIEAGYAPGSAHVTANRMLNNDKVSARIREIQEKAEDEAILSIRARKVLLSQIARGEVRFKKTITSERGETIIE